MGYTTLADCKEYLGISGTVDDSLLESLADAAQKAIDNFCHRVFEATADATRYLDVATMVEGRTLYLDKDLCAITSITNNADAVSVDLLATTDYITQPRNSTPYWAIKLAGHSGKYWRYTYEPENGIKIVGRWAYSTSAPDDIEQACKRLVGYYLKLKDAQVFTVTALPEMGQIFIPKGIPEDVKIMLSPYVRLF